MENRHDAPLSSPARRSGYAGHGTADWHLDVVSAACISRDVHA
jgi:hypothetical protein